ncbi:MAG: IclR family transcriptional regulator [Rhodospirillales bacterium]|nr:IclR family transcriptional regulator [Rhodospirillales bacterium]
MQSLDRGLGILEELSTAGRPLGITDLSRRLGLSKGSVSRFVTTLVQRNYVLRDPDTAKYRLGLRLIKLGHMAAAKLDIRDLAQPVMARLHAATSETVHLTVLSDEGYMVFLDKLDSNKGTRPNIQLSAHLPPHCVANGKAILAFRPRTEAERILRGNLHRHTKTTITRWPEMQVALDNVRRLGHAENHGEFRDDVSGIAAPIRDHTNLAVAALGISVPTNRMASEHCEKLTRLVTAGAREISLAIGRRLDDEEGMDSVKPPVPAGMAATTGATERRAKGPIARRGKEVS